MFDMLFSIEEISSAAEMRMTAVFGSAVIDFALTQAVGDDLIESMAMPRTKVWRIYGVIHSCVEPRTSWRR